jgi:hypothetical protein
MKTQTVAANPMHPTSRYLLIAAVLIGGLTLAVPRAGAQVNSGAGTKTQGADFNLSCEETHLDPNAECEARIDGNDSQTPSFEIWCLQIELYPARRCDARTGDDIQAYEHYRSLADQFHQQRADREEGDRELMNRLNRDPLSHDQMDIVP